MPSNDQDSRMMSPWEGPHELPIPLKAVLNQAIGATLLLWFVSCIHGLLFAFGLAQYTAATCTDLNSKTSFEDAKDSLDQTALPTYSRVVFWIQFIQIGFQACTLTLPGFGMLGSCNRKIVAALATYVRFLTALAVVASVLRLSSFSREGTAALAACVPLQIRMSADAAIDAATATALCKSRLAWVAPVNIIALLLDLGCMLFVCRSVLTYERKLLAERYPAYSQGLLFQVLSSSGRDQAAGAYAPLALDADEHDDDRYEKRK